MILKYSKQSETCFDDAPEESATEGNEWVVISGVSRYQYGYFKSVTDDPDERDMYILYFLNESDDVAHSITIRRGGLAYAMTDSGKTIERISLILSER